MNSDFMHENFDNVNRHTHETGEKSRDKRHKPFHDIALDLFRRGYRPIPQHAGEKKPHIKGFQNYAHEAPSEDILRYWIETFGDGSSFRPADVSVVNGSTLLTVDIDVDGAPDVVNAVRAALPITPSGKRGRPDRLSLFFRGHPTLRKGVITLTRGKTTDVTTGEVVPKVIGHVELLAERNLTTLPASWHGPAGRRYSWDGTPLTDIDAADLPELVPADVESWDAVSDAIRGALGPLGVTAELVMRGTGSGTGGGDGPHDAAPELIALIRKMLAGVPYGHRDNWIKLGFALKAYGGDEMFDVWDEWSERVRTDPDQLMEDRDTRWAGFNPEGGPGLLIAWFKKNGIPDAGARLAKLDGFKSEQASASDFDGSTAIPDDDADADDALMRELLDLLTWDGAPETVVFEEAYIEALARIRGRDEAAYQRWRGLLKDAGVSYATLRALDRATDERVKTAREVKKATAGAERAERMRASADRRNRDAAEPSDFNDPDTCVEWFNDRCAIVNVSGQTAVAYDWRPVVEFAGERSAELRFRDKRVLVVDDDGDADMVPAFRFWAQSPKRRLFDGVAFVPARYGSNDPGDDGVYNLWRGWGAPPADCSAEEAAEGCKLIRAHMRTIVCSGNEDHYRYLVRWLAHLVQRPWEKPGVAVVTRGKKRIGKDTLGTYISRMVGSAHSLHLAGSDRLVDRFNGDFKQALFTHVEEGSWGGDRKAENVLKSLISAPTMTVEDKFMPRLKIRNATRFFLSSNESWVIPASDDEARYFVLDVSEARRSDHDYFRAINAEMDDDGPAMLHRWLLEQDISDFEVRDVPRTDALRDQAIEGYRDVHAFIFDILNGGHGFDHWTEAEPLEIAPKDLHARYLRAAEKQRNRFNSSIGPQQFTRRLRDVLPIAMGTGRMVRRNAKASWSFRLDLAQCRAEFEAQAGTIEWEDTGGETVVGEGFD
ncbi:DUF5906 domain-containing protein [Pseudochelatococcus lubricantis]|uniref:DUF5906 domain-containing protein n=1 Tax=Pseudochelatococcus lubricantis TaxID=1538102 RepID=UPI0035E4F19A